MASLKKIFRPPVFADEDLSRTAVQLNAILIVTAVLLALLSLFSFVNAGMSFNRPGTIIIGGLSLIMVGLLTVLRLGQVRLASYLFLLIGWSGLAYLNWIAEGIRDNAFVAFFIIILAAGLLIGWRAALLFTALSAAAGWVYAYAESIGLIVPVPGASFDRARELTAISIIVGLLIYFLISSLQQNLVRARQSNRELATLSAELESRVAARVQDLSLAAGIGRQVLQVRSLEQLLTQAVQLIHDAFNLYQTQVYLTDEQQERLILQASTGYAGNRILAAGHQLPLDQTSLNGMAALRKQPILVNDTSQSSNYRPHPLLPDTHAELVLPLIIGDKVLGVLDLQSNRTDILDEASLPAFQIVAGQLAIAINNARLFGEREQANASLQEAQARTQTILDSIAVPVVISFTQDSRVAYVNDALAEVIGIPRDELIGRQTPDFYMNLQERAEFLQQLQANGRVQNYETQLKRADGTAFWAILSGHVINYQGQPAVLGTLVNVDQRRKAEETIAQRATQLQTIAQISTIANSILDEQRLLQEVVDLIKTRFGLYHAHIYLLESKQENLVLAAGAGEVGRQMVAEKRSISLAQTQSLVARAARTRESVIVNDVVREATFLPNPMLPDTRAEMAIPMIAGQELIGVLDVQANRVGYFSTEDANIQMTLAAQVAIALQNARAYTQAQQQAMIIENLGTIIVTTDMHGNVTYVNPTGLRTLGITKEALQQTRFTDYYTSESVKRLLKQGIPTMQAEGVWRGELVLRTPDNRYIPVDQTISLIYNAASGEQFVAATIIDISEQKRAETARQQALQEAQTFRRLVEAFNQGVAIAELDGAISYANPALLGFLGFEELAQLQGESITNFYPGEIRLTAELEAIPTALEQGSWSGEMVLHAPNGREIPTLDNYTLVTNEAGEPTYLALVITNITERKEAEKAQQRLAAALEERLLEVNALQRAMTHAGWQAFFATQERPIQGFHYWDGNLRLISGYERPQSNEFTNAPLSATQVTQIVLAPESHTTAVPMQVRGQTIGLIGARSPDGKPIDRKTQALLQAISAQVAEALERARLFEETELGRQQLDAQARELAVINEVAQSVSQLLEPADLLETIFHQVQRAITADAFIVATYDERTDMMSYPLVYDEGQRYQPIPGRPSADNPWLQVVQSGKPILLNRTAEEVAERLAHLEERAEQRLGQPGKVSASLMFVPLFLGQRAIGALSVQSYTQAAYGEHDLALLTGIANHVAVALENARLYTEAQQRAEREAMINAITRKVEETLTIEQALETAVAELTRIFQSPYAVAEVALSGQENGRSMFTTHI